MNLRFAEFERLVVAYPCGLDIPRIGQAFGVAACDLIGFVIETQHFYITVRIEPEYNATAQASGAIRENECTSVARCPLHM